MQSTKKPSSFGEKLKKLFWFAVKIAIAATIVYILVSRNFKEVAEGFMTFNYLWLIPAAGLYLFHMVVCAIRWYKLTQVLGIKLSWQEAISLTMQAYFFSLVVPGGAIGGDLVKIGVLSARSKPGSKVEGACTILMDRIVGMIALFVSVILITIPAIPTLMKAEIPGIELSANMKILGIAAIFLLCLTGLAASAAVFCHRQLAKIPPFGALMKWGDKISHGMVTRMTGVADVYRTQWKVVFWATFWSIPLVHLMIVAVFGCLVAGLSADGASVLTVVAAVLIGSIVGLMPFFPSGVGGRDVATITILVAGGMAAGDAKTAQLLYTAMLIAFNLFGGLFFIIDPGKKRRNAVAPEETRE